MMYWRESLFVILAFVAGLFIGLFHRHKLAYYLINLCKKNCQLYGKYLILNIQNIRMKRILKKKGFENPELIDKETEEKIKELYNEKPEKWKSMLENKLNEKK